MMQIHYAGPRPRISHQGVFFDKGKEDKYIYLNAAVGILQAIDKDYTVQDRYETFIHKNNKFTDEKIVEILKQYDADLETEIEQGVRQYEQHIDEMAKRVKVKPLSEEERRIWITNIHMMRPYLLQREINKLYYIYAIRMIKNIIRQKKIREIEIDFTLLNWHILESIAGNLEYGTKSVPTRIKIEPDNNGRTVARLYINQR